MSGRDDGRMAALMTAIGGMAGRPLAALTREQLDFVRDAGFDVAAGAVEEKVRRENAPHGEAQLRLVARDGELTAAGRAIVKVQAHNAAKSRGRRSA